MLIFLLFSSLAFSSESPETLMQKRQALIAELAALTAAVNHSKFSCDSLKPFYKAVRREQPEKSCVKANELRDHFLKLETELPVGCKGSAAKKAVEKYDADGDWFESQLNAPPKGQPVSEYNRLECSIYIDQIDQARRRVHRLIQD